MKTVSRKGRPRSEFRKTIDSLGHIAPDGCQRTKMNFVYALPFIQAMKQSTPEQQRAVFGCLMEEVDGKFPRGFNTMATEAGRYMHEGNIDPSSVVGVVVHALAHGHRLRDLRAHFRRLRLGEKEGNWGALLRSLCLALDGYRRDFPLTKKEQTLRAIDSLRKIVEKEK